MPQAGQVESIDTFAANCTTPKDVFNLGDTVCVKVTDAPLRASAPLRRINWSGPAGDVEQTIDVTSNPQTDLFVIPASGTSVIDGVTIDNRGTWAASINSTSDSSTRAIAYFTVSDPQHAAADLVVYNFSTNTTAPVQPGDNTGFYLWASNNGPDVAQNVHLTQATPPNLTYVSVTQDSGPAFTCTHSLGVTDCVISSLPVDSVATLTINYSVNGGASNGVTTSRADISSDTNDPRTGNNSSEAQVEIRANGAPPATCSLNCPQNMTVTANTTQGGQAGAIVTFSNAEASGDCGTTIASPASGTFFPVGTTQVSVTSSQGGGGCSFTVTVIDTTPPTISCPANLGVTAPAGDCDATVDAGTPTATGNGVTVSGVRSDGQALNAPYPAGTTTITWTATDSDERTATCSQTITVTINDTTNPTITAPPDVVISTPPGTTGSCGLVVGETELGTPNASDNCTVNVTRTGVPNGGFFPVGTTVVTYTARDGAGNTATATQNVTVTDATPPTIVAPADASYTCQSEVPAASPSQATAPYVDANGDIQNGPPSDNCGTPTVTVSETSSGAGSASSPRIITRTFTATDSHGNSASATQTITVIDNVPPSISLNGAGSVTVECHTSFTDPGASASDNCAGIAPVAVTGSVNANVPGTYTLSYTATDAAGNQSSTLTRTVTVVDTAPPSIALNGASPMTVECHTAFSDPGATASDACAGNLTSAITETGSVNPNVVGSYTLTYSVSDGQGHNASVNRTVNVVDTTAPTISLNGANPMTVECHTSFTDPGATANDGCAGAVAVTASGSVNVNVTGTYTITYSAHDPSNNTATKTRTVNVVDTTPPTITLKNVTISLWPPNHKYKTINVTDLVQSASDGCDGGVDINDVFISKVTSDEAANDDGDGNTTNDIVIASACKSVDLRSERSGNGNGRVYTITFKVRDAAGNSTTVTAKVSVPHNNGSTAIDSGVSYTVTSSCQ